MTGVALFLVTLVSALALAGCDGASASGGEAARSDPNRTKEQGRTVAISDVVHVSRVLSMDTIEIDEPVDGLDVVRLIGVDASESSSTDYDTYPYGLQAREFTASRLGVGTEVALEFDVEKTDRSGRLLAYVWLLDDGVLFNELLLREGYAQVATSSPNVKYEDRLLAAQREAREAEKGLWTLP
jgi:micrococcal nuclease